MTDAMVVFNDGREMVALSRGHAIIMSARMFDGAEGSGTWHLTLATDAVLDNGRGSDRNRLHARVLVDYIRAGSAGHLGMLHIGRTHETSHRLLAAADHAMPVEQRRRHFTIRRGSFLRSHRRRLKMRLLAS